MRNLTRCICEGENSAETRIAELRKSPRLMMDWDGLLAVRNLNRFDIERDRAAAKVAATKTTPVNENELPQT